ncbi:MAG: hypothetical protein IKY29_01270, partial [Clostridia bacterium]|nr:hypothetical protein [Clostridia bacterium]
RTHGSSTQQAKVKFFSFCDAPCESKISSKNDFASLPAARGGKTAGDALDPICLSPQPALKRGTEAVSKGGSLWRVSWLLLAA